MEDDVSLVRDKVDIVQLIGEYTPLKQTGKNFRGICPLHQEKSPSFFVRPERGLWYCFGCQRGGDVFSFLMEKENLSFGEALQVLAKRVGVVLTGRQDRDSAQKKERLFQILSASTEFYTTMLQGSGGAPARDYLQKRGVSTQAIEQFRIGYAPDSWRATGDHLRSKGFSDELLLQSGQVIQSERGGSPYDRFRGRLMFPIADHLGRIVGFSGRILQEAKEAKYVNTPETPVFKKGHILFGYHLAEPSAREKGYTILVEGNLDVVSLVEGGITNVMAPLGTGLTGEQLRLLERIQPKVLLAFDADEAGQKAAFRALLEATRQGFEVKIARLTSGKDPDEAIRQQRAGLIQDLKQAQTGFEYVLTNAQNTHPATNAYGKKRIAEELFVLLQVIPDQVVREGYLQRLASELNINPSALEHDFAAWNKSHTASTPNTPVSAPVATTTPYKKSRQELLEEYAIALLFNMPNHLLRNDQVYQVILEIEDRIFTQPNLAHFFGRYRELVQEKDVEVTKLIDTLEEEQVKELDLLIMRDFGSLFENETEVLKEVKLALRQLQELYYRQKMRELAQQKDAVGEDTERNQQLNDMMKDITQRLRNIESQTKNS
jgi:DNA primase